MPSPGLTTEFGLSAAPQVHFWFLCPYPNVVQGKQHLGSFMTSYNTWQVGNPGGL